MISITFACMGREKHLIESLNSWLDVKEVTEIIIVDWSCKKKLIDDPDISQNNITKIIRVNNQQYFSMTKSYNLAIRHATNKIILKLDCDHKNINSSWLKYLALDINNELDNYYIVGDYKFAKSYSGLMLVNKKDFLWYNENMAGWGYDDTDIYNRIEKIKNIRRIPFFCIKDYIYHIPHDDILRTENFAIKNKSISNNLNKQLSNQTFSFSSYTTILEQYNYVELIENQ